MREIKDIKEIQQISYGILKYVDKICKENNIKYFLAGGTLLGAVRHKGFIPWDDDIDILMPREDYEKFLKIMDESKHNQYKALHYGENCHNFFYRFTKVVDLTTKLEESTLISNKDLGVFIDIFPADGIDITKSKKLVTKHRSIGRMLAYSSMTKISNQKNEGKLKILAKKIIYPYAKMMGPHYWFKKYSKLIKKYPLEKNDYATLYSGAWGEREIFPKSYMDDVVYLQFEDGKFPAFKNYDGHLTHMYGDYMTPPPKEKQITHHDFKIYKK